jgi:hypothetical protein
MHERVRREIAAHSLERTQIIVLDALLKLRQLCCDPALGCGSDPATTVNWPVAA